MKKLASLFICTLFFLLFFIVFAPKTLAYYKLEHLLQKEHIIISNEHLEEHPFSFIIKKGTLYVKRVQVGKFETIQIYPDILFNMVRLHNFYSFEQLAFLPKIFIKDCTIFYTPLYPIKIFLKGTSSLGKIEGNIHLKKRSGFIDIQTKKHLPFPVKKIKEDLYRYEFRY